MEPRTCKHLVSLVGEGQINVLNVGDIVHRLLPLMCIVKRLQCSEVGFVIDTAIDSSLGDRSRFVCKARRSR